MQLPLLLLVKDEMKLEAGGKMSLLEKVLQSSESKEAIGEGLVELIRTGDLDNAVDSMLDRGDENGALPAAKLAFVLDILGFDDKL